MELIREVERYIRSVKSENEYLRKTNSELTNVSTELVEELVEELKDLRIENRALREIMELGRENDKRCIVSDQDILDLIKNEGIDSWERLLERTGYTNLEHLRKRVRRMQGRGLLLMGNKYKCFDVKLIEG